MMWVRVEPSGLDDAFLVLIVGGRVALVDRGECDFVGQPWVRVRRLLESTLARCVELADAEY